ncbi:helix-turn-helix domain-containing protein [Ruminococcoides intestinihominis]|uniref:Helix-turn-helix transcriptional regulator n=2 Tax=Ruminococcoides intestinihominis TaxID=3133161 RepID=A0ABV1HVL7_9FIRM
MIMVYDFGLRLKELRKKKKLSQSQVSARLNITKSSISGYENNIITPSNDIIVKLALLYGVTTDYLLGLDNNESIVISDLTNNQKEIVRLLVNEFKLNNRNANLSK